ncbi:MAG: DnaA regulatory inactivator Hda [Gammaproteobacteria bacterium GWF2_41_13]|nr:MAG: DnaA regulatory inactivator Hda [Gammaproteobacteria bacterium GWF2_41_13]
MPETQQLTLALALKDPKTLSNYYVGNNREILTALHHTATGRGKHFLYLWGPEKVGLTHLLQACCHTASQKKLTTMYIPLADLSTFNPTLFENLESAHLVCIDDLHQIAQKRNWEEAFFHCFNRIIDAKKRLIIAARKPPQLLELTLPDLTSRLSAGIIYQLHHLTDNEKMKALIERAKARGFELSLEIAQFILHRHPRNLGALFEALDVLDRASLEAKHKLTLPFVKKVLKL